MFRNLFGILSFLPIFGLMAEVHRQTNTYATTYKIEIAVVILGVAWLLMSAINKIYMVFGRSATGPQTMLSTAMWISYIILLHFFPVIETNSAPSPEQSMYSAAITFGWPLVDIISWLTRPLGKENFHEEA